MKPEDYLNSETLTQLSERPRSLTSFRWVLLTILLAWALIAVFIWAAFE